MTTKRYNVPSGVPDDLDLLTVNDAAHKCRIGTRTLHRAIENGLLVAIRLDRGDVLKAYRIRRSDLRDWQERGMPSGAARSRCSSRLEGVDPVEEVDAA
jgi:excisionase family DNA binding protein